LDSIVMLAHHASRGGDGFGYAEAPFPPKYL
jgi:hypothetical protein